MTSKTAVEIIDSILLAFDSETRNNMLDYIERGYDICSGRSTARGQEWTDEAESKRKIHIPIYPFIFY